MARLILQSKDQNIDVELTPNEMGGMDARCVRHWGIHPRRCGWHAHYDDLNDATKYAADHADGKA